MTEPIFTEQPKHTPGPWEATRGAQADAFSIEGPTLTIANVKYARRMDETVSNARLISAGPELLQACEQVYKNGLGQRELFLLEKALAKATGDANDC